MNQKTAKESNKSIQFGTHVTWLILKHSRRGAQRNLEQELTKLKMATKVKHPTRGAQKDFNRK